MTTQWRTYAVGCLTAISVLSGIFSGGIAVGHRDAYDQCYLVTTGDAKRGVRPGSPSKHLRLRTLKIASSAYYNDKCEVVITDAVYDAVKEDLLGYPSTGQRLTDALPCARSQDPKLVSCSPRQVEEAYHTADVEGKLNIITTLSHHAFGDQLGDDAEKVEGFTILQTKLTDTFLQTQFNTRGA